MKLFLSLIIAITPFSFIRISLYRIFFKYKISYKSRINWLNLILCNNLIIEENVTIGYFNIIKGINKMIIKKNTVIKNYNKFRNINTCFIECEVNIISHNIFSGTDGKHTPFKEFENIIIGKGSIITNKHYFDLTDSIEIGEDVIFGGNEIQLWTHGFDLFHIKKQSPIKIGNHCYIGSRAIIMPGCNITDFVSIGSGTTVTKSINVPGFYVSSTMIKKSIIPDFRDNDNIISKDNFKFIRK